DREVRFAVGGKFRPVTRHRRVHIDQSAIHQHVESETGDALGDGHHANDGVALPFAAARVVLPTAPQIHHSPAADRDAHGGAHFVLAAVVLAESLGYSCEFRVIAAVQ